MKLKYIYSGILFFSTCGFAQGISQSSLAKNFLLNADLLSFGGAGRATSSSSQTMLVNPAAVARHKNQVAIGGSYAKVESTDSSPWTVSGTDFRASPSVAFGAFYGFDQPTIEGTEAKVHYAAVVIAKDITPKIFIGTGLKAYKTKYSGLESGGPDGFDMDFGIQFKPSEFISLGLNANHVFQGKNFEEFPLLIGGGIALELEGTGKLLIDLEQDNAVNSANRLNAYFGGEVMLTEGVYLRGGFGIDNVRDADFFSSGLVLQGPKVNLVALYSQTVNTSDKTYGLSVDLMF